MSEQPKWTVGQRAVIDRRIIVTVDKVLPSGRAKVGDRTFDANGLERNGGDKWRRSRLESLTPEIENEMALVKHAAFISNQLQATLLRVERWTRESFGPWPRRVPAASDVERGERLLTAIDAAMNDSARPGNGG